MQTWLDTYARGYRARAQAVLDKMPGGSDLHSYIRTHLLKAAEDDGYALRFFSIVSMQAYDARTAGEAEFTPGMMSQILWQTNIARFVLDLDSRPPTAAVLSADIVDALSGATISQEIRQRGRTEAIIRRLTYLDVPHGALRIGEGMQVRALFISGNHDARGEQITFTAR
jgi:hypothetical protein